MHFDTKFSHFSNHAATRGATPAGWRLARRGLLAAMALMALGLASVARSQEWEQSVLPLGFAPQEMAQYDEELGIYVVPIAADDAEHLVGLWRQLRALHVNGPEGKTFDGAGAFVHAKTVVTRCPAIAHDRDRLASFRIAWTADAVLTYTFYLKNRNALEWDVPGAEAEVVQSVNTTKIQRKVDVQFAWLPERGLLLVRVSDFDYPLDLGPQAELGQYLVKARSLTAFQGATTSVKSQFSKSGVEVSAATELVAGKRRMKVQVGGCSYALEYGLFSAIRSNFGDDMQWSFKASWISDADLSYEEEIAVVDEGVCRSKQSLGFKFKLSDGIEPGFEATGSAGCIVTAGQAPVRVRWQAIPILDLDTGEQEGLFAAVRFLSRKRLDGSAVCWHQPRFGALMNWSLKAVAIGDAGGGILVDNVASRPMQTARINVREY